MAKYRLSNLADKDLGNIASYTIQRFGIRQASLYRDGLFKAFEMIFDFPLIGSDQSQIKKISVVMCMSSTQFTIVSM
jgi:toxin ParE1/3/4